MDVSPNGFGFTDSKAGVETVYYYPSDKEWEAWKKGLKPCTQKAEASSQK
jgi:hypothetical protein